MSSFPNESVTSRPTMAGTTMIAAINVTPRSCNVDTIVAAMTSANSVS